MANANGEGSIYKRMRNGRHVGYIGAVSYTDDAGKPKRHMVYGKTRTDVRDKMKRVRERLDNGTAVRDSKRALADWLVEREVEETEPQQLAPPVPGQRRRGDGRTPQLGDEPVQRPTITHAGTLHCEPGPSDDRVDGQCRWPELCLPEDVGTQRQVLTKFGTAAPMSALSAHEPHSV